MNIVMKKINEIRKYDNNPKMHTQKQVDLIVRSIKEFGFLNPIIVTKDYEIIAGHGRFEAAKQIGLTEIPCLYVENLTEAQIKAYRIIDNRLAELADWNVELLEQEFGDLKRLNFDIDLLGFSNTFGIDKLKEFPSEEINMDYLNECPKCKYRW